jgi:hypothetical protein
MLVKSLFVTLAVVAIFAGLHPALFNGMHLSPISYAQGQFPTEQQAQQHCPNDTVVWLNLPSGIYHFKGQRWYGNTRSGAFVCRSEADKAGDRATRNGE